MSIERSSTSSVHKSAASGEAGHVKGKKHFAGEAGSSDAGGFASLLMTLGADDAGGLATGLDPAAQVPTGEGALPDPGLLLAQSLRLKPELPSELPKTAGIPVAGNAELAATEAVLQTVTTGMSRGGPVLPKEPGKARADTTDLLSAEQGAGKLQAFSEVAVDAMKETTQSHRGAATLHAPDLADESSRQGKGHLAAEAQINKLMQAQDRAAQSAALPQLIQTAGTGEPGMKQTERFSERLALKQIGGAEGGDRKSTRLNSSHH
jgi:hypothetical protein